MLGTATRDSAKRVLLLGSGELGKEVAIECQRLGLEVIACDRYANAPAMQVAHRSHVFDMLDAEALQQVIDLENRTMSCRKLKRLRPANWWSWKLRD